MADYVTFIVTFSCSFYTLTVSGNVRFVMIFVNFVVVLSAYCVFREKYEDTKVLKLKL